MIKHQILLSSSYSEGTRICLDFPESDQQQFRDAVEKVGSAYDGKRVSFSTHTVHTDSMDWDSVIKKDPYFDDVRVIDTVDEFIRTIQKDRYLTGLDVAKYILAKGACTHTRIEKLTYLCYADYLCRTKKRLFTDKVYAFKYGPVVDSVYSTFREYSKERPSQPIDDKEMFSFGNIVIQMRSRILFAEDGDEKLSSIEDTLKRYSSVSTRDLVELTHTKGSPWDHTMERLGILVSETYYEEITDEDIIEYHSSEEYVESM